MTTQVAPQRVAQRITSPEQALETAHRLAEQFSPTAAERDSQRRLPVAELADLFASGLGAITVPQEFGGPALSNRVLAQVIAILSQGDASIGQVPQNHYYALEVLRVNGSPQQQRRLYQEALDGVHFGNALAEFASKAAHHRSTSLARHEGQWQLSGQKFYATGALYAGRIPTAARGEDGKEQLVFLPRNTTGLSITDDWSGFGQRTTGSGSVTLEQCPVDEEDIVPSRRRLNGRRRLARWRRSCTPPSIRASPKPRGRTCCNLFAAVRARGLMPVSNTPARTR